MIKTINFKKIYKHFPKKFKNKSIIFIVLLIFSSLLETFSIGIIFPILEFLVNGNFPTFFLGFDFDHIISDENFIQNFLFFIIFLYLFKSIFLVLFNYWQLKFSHNIFKYLSSNLFNKYLLSSISFHHKKNSAVLLRNTWVECRNYGNCIDLFLKLTAESLMIIFIVILLIYIAPINTLSILFILIAFIFLFYFFTSTKIYNYGKRKLEASEIAIKVLVESFNGIRDIKITSTEVKFIENFKKSLSKFVKSSNYQTAIVQSPRIIFEFIFISMLLIYLLFLSQNPDKMSVSLSLLSIYAVSAFKLIPSVMKVLSILQTLKGLQPSIDMLDKEFKNIESSDSQFREKNIKSLEFNKSIRFKNVSFSYNNDNFILKNFCLVLSKNQTIGISGRSGSGKSTLVDIITGLLKPSEGQILIDEKIDINDGYLVNWQKKIGYVSQNIFLLDDTVINNIGFGLSDEKIDIKKINQVLKDVKLYDYFNSQENKFQTIVGERGVKLSGGQAQRIAIARELYRNPELIIFDESTSALDIDTENQILECIKNLNKKITLIIISHKKNTLKICDEIIDIDKINKR